MCVRLLLACVLALASASTARAGDEIWSALVLATNVPSPKALPVTLAPFGSKLGVFGYNQFEIIGSHTETLHDDDTSHWLLPSDDFYLGVESRPGRAAHEHLLNLQFYQGKRLLVETNTRIGPHSPLFIRGPLYGLGQLIIVLLVR